LKADLIGQSAITGYITNRYKGDLSADRLYKASENDSLHKYPMHGFLKLFYKVEWNIGVLQALTNVQTWISYEYGYTAILK
jgi:hypothetical protein